MAPTRPEDHPARLLKKFFSTAGIDVNSADGYVDHFTDIYDLANNILNHAARKRYESWLRKNPKPGDYRYLLTKKDRDKIKNDPTRRNYCLEPIKAWSFDSPLPSPYTQHDLGHAKRVFFHSAKLLKDFNEQIFKKIPFHIGPREAFLLAAACFVHDLGMWKTWLSWQFVRDDIKQRTIHGRLARAYLHEAMRTHSITLSENDIPIIADICELHQSTVNKSEWLLFKSKSGHGRRVYSETALLLGDVLMLADALDFHKDRSIKTGQNRGALSDFEHGINRYVHKVSLSLTPPGRVLEMEITFKHNAKWDNSLKGLFAGAAKEYFNTYITQHHINKMYLFSKKHKQGGSYRYNRVPFVLDVKLKYTSPPYNVSTHGFLKPLNNAGSIVPSPIKVWSGAFDDLLANKKVIADIKRIYKTVIIKTDRNIGGVLILLHDEITDTLRYCLPQNTNDFVYGTFSHPALQKGRWPYFKKTLKQVSQTIKCGISGYAYFCNCLRIVPLGKSSKSTSWEQDIINKKMPGDYYFRKCKTLVTFPIPGRKKNQICGQCVVLTSDDLGVGHVEYLMTQIPKMIDGNKFRNLSQWISRYANNGPYSKK
jgi:hypothetical protein